MTVTDPYTGIGVITRGAFDSDMAAISLSLHSSCNDIALNEKNSPSFCQIHFYRGIFHLLSSCTLSTLRAFNSSSFHPSSPQIHPFSMIPVTPQRAPCQPPGGVPRLLSYGNVRKNGEFNHPFFERGACRPENNKAPLCARRGIRTGSPPGTLGLLSVIFLLMRRRYLQSRLIEKIPFPEQRIE